ncbi:MAG: metal-dependent transcriptional regulator [Acidobacteriota bacterium]|nr:metal-dependent transcriptional regulator [Acidobacteriota bacterium]MDE3146131.1 metal-dependent transcriptional regulator [Acidobacteriota bacterium]
MNRYLETIYCIQGEDELVRPGRLAVWLNVSPPTVSDALHRLERDGWIEVARDRSVLLTQKGSDEAAAIVRRHRLLERWMTDVLGMDWASADAEADLLSSAVSDEVVSRIDASMNFPTTCPHGNPIPGRDPGYGTLTALADLRRGQLAYVRRISEVAEHEARELLTTLGDFGISEGSVVLADRDVEETDGFTFRFGENRISVTLLAGRQIWVEPIPEGQGRN